MCIGRGKQALEPINMNVTGFVDESGVIESLLVAQKNVKLDL